MKQKIITAFLMGFITTGIISFILISINVGYKGNFLGIWLKSWGMAYMIIVPVILFIGPKVQQFASYLLKKE